MIKVSELELNILHVLTQTAFKYMESTIKDLKAENEALKQEVKRLKE
jgi:cell division protein FtsB